MGNRSRHSSSSNGFNWAQQEGTTVDPSFVSGTSALTSRRHHVDDSNRMLKRQTFSERSSSMAFERTLLELVSGPEPQRPNTPQGNSDDWWNIQLFHGALRRWLSAQRSTKPRRPISVEDFYNFAVEHVTPANGRRSWMRTKSPRSSARGPARATSP